MKKIISILLVLSLCFALCSCGVFSEKLFEDDGIYQEYDDLTIEEQEQLIDEAVKQGYTLGMDVEGRVTLAKDGRTLVLGRSKTAGI